MFFIKSRIRLKKNYELKFFSEVWDPDNEMNKEL